MGRRVIKTNKESVRKEIDQLAKQFRAMGAYFDGISHVFEEHDRRLHALEEKLGVNNEESENTENSEAGRVEEDGAGGATPAGGGEDRRGDDPGAGRGDAEGEGEREGEVGAGS
jgi:hypothetical protein